MRSLYGRFAGLVGKLILAMVLVQIYWRLAVVSDQLSDMYMWLDAWQSVQPGGHAIRVAALQATAFGMVATAAGVIGVIIALGAVYHLCSDVSAIRREVRQRRVPLWAMRRDVVC